MTTLTTALLDLLKELENTKIPLIVGGGFGIYLRYEQIVQEKRGTLFDELPEPRSTNDLDLFLRAELLMDMDSMGTIRLRESAYYRRAFQVSGFLDTLQELFCSKPATPDLEMRK